MMTDYDTIRFALAFHECVTERFYVDGKVHVVVAKGKESELHKFALANGWKWLDRYDAIGMRWVVYQHEEGAKQQASRVSKYLEEVA
jgi:hypothetical protein